jgi:hypothetical protein
MKTELEFPHNYEVEVGIDWPSNGERIVRYQRKNTRSNQDGVLALIRPPEAEPWYALFQFGDGPLKSNGAYSTLDPSMLCVVANGDACFVHTADPTNWAYIPCYPVVDVRPAVAARLLLFTGFKDIVALGSSGPSWTTEDLAFDGFSIDSIEGYALRGRTDPCPCHGIYEFTVDLETGKHTGVRHKYTLPS